MRKTFFFLCFIIFSSSAMERLPISLGDLNHPVTYVGAGFAVGVFAGIVAHRCYSQGTETRDQDRYKQKKLISKKDSQDAQSKEQEGLDEEKISLLSSCRNPIFNFFIQEGEAEKNESLFKEKLKEEGFKDDAERYLLECFEELKNIDAARRIPRFLDNAQLQLSADVSRYLNDRREKSKGRRRVFSIYRQLAEK